MDNSGKKFLPTRDSPDSQAYDPFALEQCLTRKTTSEPESFPLLELSSKASGSTASSTASPFQKLRSKGSTLLSKIVTSPKSPPLKRRISKPITSPLTSELSSPSSVTRFSLSALPTGPPPPRSPRPASLDAGTLALLCDSTIRLCLSLASYPMATTSGSRSRSRAGTVGGSPVTEPLALLAEGEELPLSLPKHEMINAKGEVRPVERWCDEKSCDYALERRVSAKDGVASGMLFRDRWGGWHFVGDI